MRAVQLPLTGGCLCGACRYELRAAPFVVYACHCTDCQRQTGSAFNMTMPAPRDAFSITKGEPAAFARTTARGRQTTIRFCGTCASRLFAESNPTTVAIRPGTLDDTTWLTPAAQFYLSSAHAWARLDDMPVSHETQPDDGFRDAIRAWRKTAPTFLPPLP
jgi:hypothetical protein